MTFLNPAILLGLAAASIPVIIHLLNLRKLKKIEFSTLSFLKELQKNKIRRVKIKQWILLALRVIIILLIVTAFARPTLEGVKIGGTTSAAKSTAIFILDDTFSMSVIGQKGSYFNQGRQIIKNILNNFEDGDEAGLLLVSGNEGGEYVLTTNFQSLVNHLDGINVSDATGTINSALVKAAEILNESKNFNKEIYLLTDFQVNRTALDENIMDLGRLLNDQVKLYSFDFSDRELDNIAIERLKVKTKIFEKNKPVIFEAKLVNHSDNQVKNLVTSLFINSKRSAQLSIDLKPHESKNILLEGNVDKTGQSDVFVEIEDDDVIKDNTRYGSVNIPKRYLILLLYDELSDVQFVKLALQSAKSDGSIEVKIKPADRINSIQLKEFNVIFLISSNPEAVQDKLKNFVTGGGGLVIYPPSHVNTNGFNTILNSFSIPPATGVIENDGNTNSNIDFEGIDVEHPLLQNIFKDEKKISVESPLISKFLKTSPAGKGKNIITLLDGSSFLSEYNYVKGRLLVYNAAPVMEWSDFPVKSIFAPLIYRSVIYLSSNGNGNFEIHAGENINFNISQRTEPLIKIISPDESIESINLKDSNRNFFRFTKTFTTGNYKLFSGGIPLETVSVNTDPVESNVSYINSSEFDDYLNNINFKGSHFNIPLDSNPADTILQARFGSELWRYFLIAAFILALIEMTISRAAKKDLVGINK